MAYNSIVAGARLGHDPQDRLPVGFREGRPRMDDLGQIGVHWAVFVAKWARFGPVFIRSAVFPGVFWGYSSPLTHPFLFLVSRA